MNKEENEQLEEIKAPIQTVYSYLVNGVHKKEALFMDMTRINCNI